MPKDPHASLDQHIGTFLIRLAAENYKPRTMKTYRHSCSPGDASCATRRSGGEYLPEPARADVRAGRDRAGADRGARARHRYHKAGALMALHYRHPADCI